MDLTLAVKDYVARDFRSAAIFEKYGIDYCCKGQRPLGEACTESGINTAQLESDLLSLKNQPAGDRNRYHDWKLDYLIQHIIHNHHSYIETSVPRLTQLLRKIVSVHSERHPELIPLSAAFEKLASELKPHLEKEENAVFPAITALVQSGSPEPGREQSIMRLIQELESEHLKAGSALEEIRQLTENYRVPEDACGTFAVTYQELQSFEADLHLHVYLENTILFPRALELSAQLPAQAD